MKIKRGASLAFYVTFKDTDGDPVTYNNIRCQVRQIDGTLLSELTIAETETTGRYLFSAGTTDVFPLGTHESDIEITVGGKVASSDTFKIEVYKDITRAE